MVVILVGVAWCALVALGVACRGPTRDRATERAPTIRAEALEPNEFVALTAALR